MRNGVLFFFSFLLLAFTLKESLFLSPENWPDPVYDFEKNPLEKEKILLGRYLFYEPLLSKDNSISCESCHSPFSAFTHIDHKLSHGIHDSIGTRNSPALMNLAWQKNFMWDGAINNLDMQALAPISHAAEMGSSIQEVVKKLNQSEKYRALFYAAFQDSLATGEKTLKSISQFLLTLLSSNSKYDRVMNQQEEFTEQENQGYILFQKNCSSCHTAPLFSSYSFENNGLPLDTILQDSGRTLISKKTEDAFKFKVPSLRNVEYTYPYMHDGRFATLSEVLKHYSKGVFSYNNTASQLKNGLNLSEKDRVDLIAFLLTLSDPSFVFNENYRYPK